MSEIALKKGIPYERGKGGGKYFWYDDKIVLGYHTEL